MKILNIDGKAYVAVQFTGNTAIYAYEIADALSVPTGTLPFPGHRVVVPTKMKNDGTVTLTIGRIAEVSDDELAALVAGGNVKPIIQVLSHRLIDAATKAVAFQEATVSHP